MGGILAAEIFHPSPDFAPAFEQATGQPRGLVRSPDGRLLVFGTFSSVGTARGSNLALLDADGTPSSNFAVPSTEPSGSIICATIQPDGKILIGGSFGQVGSAHRSSLARLHADGSLDTKFAPDLGTTSSVRTILTLPLGRILVGGAFEVPDTGGQKNLVCLFSNGTVDTSFVPPPMWTVRVAARGPDGRIVVSGGTLLSQGAETIVRLNEDGSRDTTFTSPFMAGEQATHIRILQDNRILVAGELTRRNGTSSEFLYRLRTDGSIDPTFAATGRLDGSLSHLELLPDGRILIAGGFQNYGGTPRRLLAILSADGALDTNFAPQAEQNALVAVAALPNDRIFVTSFGTLRQLDLTGATVPGSTVTLNQPAPVTSFARAADGSWLVAGEFTMANGIPRAGVARLSAAGAVDPTFDPPADLGLTTKRLAVLPDGKVIVAGVTDYRTPMAPFAVRLHADGSRDTTFDTTGLLGLRNFTTMAVQQDGKLVVSGSFDASTGSPRNYLLRLQTNGSLDGAFNAPSITKSVRHVVVLPDGRLMVLGTENPFLRMLTTTGAADGTFTCPPFDNEVLHVARMPNGSWLVAGSFYHADGVPRHLLARLKSDGALDTAFNPSIPIVSGARIDRIAVMDDSSIWVLGWPNDFRIAAGSSTVESVQISGSREPVMQMSAGTPDGMPMLAGYWKTLNDAMPGGMARLEAAPYPIIDHAPASTTADPGQTVAFSVGATGKDLLYQWFKNGVAIDGAVSSTLTLNNVQWSDAADYTVSVTNRYHTVTTAVATLGGTRPRPVITTQPASTSVQVGAPATLAIAATAEQNPAIQWRRAGAPIPGATQATLSLQSASLSDAGFYDAVVTDGIAHTISQTIEVRVFPGPFAGRYGAHSDFGPRLEREGGTIHAMLALPDGSCLVAGEFSSLGTAPTPQIARLLSDGSPDPAFAPAFIEEGRVRSLAVQADGRILVGGSFKRVGGRSALGIARLHANGTVDPTFEAGIGVPGPLVNLHEAAVNAIAVRPEGRILVAGTFRSIDGLPLGYLARLEANGLLDRSFVPASVVNGPVRTLHLMADGRMLISGDFGMPAYPGQKFIARLMADGQLDVSFSLGSDPIVVPNTVAVLPDETILLGFYGGLRRLLPSGATVPGWSQPITEESEVKSLVATGDGRVFIGGQLRLGPMTAPIQIAEVSTATWAVRTIHTAERRFETSVYLLAVDPAGTLHAGVGQRAGDGAASTWLRLSTGTDPMVLDAEPALRPGAVRAITALPGGRWGIGGEFTHVDGAPRSGVVIVEPDGTVDVDRNVGPGSAGHATAVVRDSTGRLVVAGAFSTFNGQATGGIVRLLDNGTPDPAFVPPAGFDASQYPYNLELLTDGDLLVYGSFSWIDNEDNRYMVRLAPNGSLRRNYPAGEPPSLGFADALARTDGRVWITGSFRNVSGRFQPHLSRLLPDGTIDTSFSAHPLSPGASLALDPQDRLLVGGSGGVERYLPDDSRDSTLSAASFGCSLVVPDITGAFIYTPGRAATGVLLHRYGGNGQPDAAFTVLNTGTGYDDLRSVSAIVPGPGDTLLLGGNRLSESGSPLSALLLLEPALPPTIVAAPAGQQATPGQNVTFSVEASGRDLTYQWFHDGVALSGATSSTLTLARVGYRQAGTYTVRITGRYGSVTSPGATITGTNPPPTITPLPATLKLQPGATLALSTVATGDPVLTYQWRRNGVAIPGATSPTLTVAGISQADAGDYDCRVWSGLSAATSTTTRVTVSPPGIRGAMTVVPGTTLGFERRGAEFRAIVPDPAGGFFAAGALSSVGTTPVTAVAKFRADGTLDTSFALPVFIGGEASAMLRQSDGKIIVGGDFVATIGSRPRHLARLNADGTLDETFAVGSGFDAPVRALAFDSSGRILVGGEFLRHAGTAAAHLTRLLPDGSADPTFHGRSVLEGAVTGIGIQPDGGLVVSGTFTRVGASASGCLAWLGADGHLLSGSPVGILPGSAAHLTPLADGRLLLAGPGLGLIRLKADRSVDWNFSPPQMDIGGSIESYSRLHDGRLVVGARSIYGGGRISRLLEDGAIDATFAQQTQIEGGPSCLAVLTDGSVVVGEETDAIGGHSGKSLQRLTDTGPVPISWPAMFRPGRVAALVPADNGWWLAGGSFDRVGGLAAQNVARVSETGVPDPLFDSRYGCNGPVTSLLPLGDGSFLIGGTFTRYGARWVPGLVHVGWEGRARETYRIAAGASPRTLELALRPGAQVAAILSHIDAVGNRVSDFLTIARSGETTPLLSYSIFGEDAIAGLHVLDNGDTLVGGRHAGRSFGQEAGPARLGPSGLPVPTYLNLPPTEGFFACFAAGAEGSVYAAGDSFYNAEAQAALPGIERRDAKGKLDTRFKPGTGFDGPVRGLIGQPDGAILAWGDFTTYSLSPMEAIGMIETTGATRADFALQGLYLTRAPSVVRLTDSGRMLLAGGTFALDGRVAHGLCLATQTVSTVVRQPSYEGSPVAGQPFVLTAEPAGDGAAYQWQYYQPPANTSFSAAAAGDAGALSLRYLDLAGATGPTLAIPLLQGAHAGYYRVIVTRAGRSVASDPVYVGPVTPASAGSRVANISTRARCLDGDNILIPGFVIEGAGQRQLLIRAVGQRLLDFGVPDVLPDPALVVKRLRNGVYEDIASNDNWGDNTNAAEIKATASRVGAFRLIDGSVDAALLLDLPAGQYTAFGRDAQARSGIAIVEIYDADATAGSAALINLSNRGYVGVGGDVMIPGFVVSSEGPRTFLIRAVGPTLASFGVGSVLSNPRLDLYRKVPDAPSDEWLLGNDDWEQSPDAVRTASTARQVRAFGLPSGSQDAACVVTLPPGSYTVHASGVGGTTGIALVEVYLVP
jgi:uncharacterized delta-60 repeat protein